MASPKIRAKRSSVEGKVPAATQLERGEFAVNTYDGKVYVVKDQFSVGIATTTVTVNPWDEPNGVGAGLSYSGSVRATAFVGDGSGLTGITAGITTFSGNYNHLLNRPTIPTNNNQLTNGAGYVTANTQLSDEQVQDIVGAMVSSNTESGITVTYQDGDGTLDFSVASQTDNNFTNADHSKLDGIEAGATSDQTAAEIRALVESASDSNVFTDADHSKLNGIASGATNVTNNNQLTNGQGFITGYTVTESDVTNHQAALSITESQISDLGTYATVATVAGIDTSGFIGAGSTFSGNYNHLSNRPTIPSNNNQLTNGAGYATQSYVNSQVSNIVDSAPSTLDTLNELAAALGDDANFSTTVTSSIATKMPLAGGTFTGDVTFNSATSGLGVFYDRSADAIKVLEDGSDKTKLIIGDDSSFSSYIEMYHDGGNSGIGYINYTGSNKMILSGTQVVLMNKARTEEMVQAVQDAGVYLYYNGGTQKFETTSDGVKVTGDITVTGTVDGVDVAALSSAVAGIDTSGFTGGTIPTNNNQLTNGAGFITNSVSGDLTLTDTATDSSAGPEFVLYRNSSSPSSADYLGQIKFQGESTSGATRLYAKITGKIGDPTNGSEDGIIEIAHRKNGSNNISGRWNQDELQLLNGTELSLGDNQNIKLGTGDDLRIFHDGSNNYIQGLQGSLILKNTSGDYFVGDVSSGSVQLNHNGSKKFETTAGGIVVTGSIDASDTISSGNSNIKIDGDTGKFFAGASNDLQIYHDGTNSAIQNTTGYLYLYGGTNNIYLRAKNDEDGIVVKPNDSVELYYNNSKKFETTSSGATVTGTLTANTFSGALSGNSTTATTATNVTVSANNGNNETVYPVFVDGATGSQGAETDTALSYNPSTDTLTAGAFSGQHSGNGAGLTALNASELNTGVVPAARMSGAYGIESSTFTVTANNSTNETVYPVFVDGATGAQGAETDTGLSYNPSSGALTAASFVGDGSALTGISAGAGGDTGLDLNDNAKIRFGSDDDIEQFFDGTRFKIQPKSSTTTSQLDFEVKDQIYIHSTSNGIFLRGNNQSIIDMYGGSGGGVYFYHNGNSKLKLEGGNWTYQGSATVTFDDHLYASSDSAIDIGTNTTRFRNIYADTLYGDGSNLTGVTAGSSDKISEGNTEAEVVDTGSDGHFKVTTEGSERLRVNSAGKIGINNSSPLYAMHFKNEMASSPSFIHMQVTGTNAVGGGGGIAFDTSASNSDSNNSLYLATIAGVRNSANNGSNDLVFSTSKSSVTGDDGNTHSPKEKLRITSSGDMGLGTNNPTSDGGTTFEIYDATTPTLRLNDGGEYKALFQLRGNDLEVRGSNGAMEFYTGNADGASSTERLSITNTGKCQVYKGTSTTGKTSGSEAFTVGNGAGNHRFAVYPDGTTVIGGTGDIGNNNIKLTNDGNITAAGDITSSSDISLKDNVITYENALDKVLAMRGVEYDRNDMEGKHEVGLIAQEVEKIIPEVVGESNGLKNIAYGKLTAVLIEAIKEQQQQIEDLKQQLNKGK